MSTYSKKVVHRPRTAQTAHVSDTDTYSILSGNGTSQRKCQWTNKVNTHMNSQTRYQLDFKRKSAALKDLPQIKMSLYDDQKFKAFLQNNFVSVSQKDFRGPPVDFQPAGLCRPEERKENEMCSQSKTTYSTTFQGYNIANPDRFNKPMPNNISLHKSKISAQSHYQQHFRSTNQSTRKSAQRPPTKTSPFPHSLPLYNQTEHRSQFVNFSSQRVAPSHQIDNLTSNLSFKGQYISENKKQFIRKEGRKRVQTAKGRS